MSVTVSPKLGTVRSRAGAQVIDGVVLVVGYAVLVVAYAFVTAQRYSLVAQEISWIVAPMVVVYFVILEGVFGATVGKKLVGIEVRRKDGRQCGLVSAATRTALRIIDGLPVLYMVGMIFVVCSGLRQRLGDRLARTIVVKSSASPV